MAVTEKKTEEQDMDVGGEKKKVWRQEICVTGTDQWNTVAGFIKII